MEKLKFDNSFTAQLPGEALAPVQSRQTPSVCYAEVLPTPVSDPKILAWSEEAAALLDLNEPPSAEHARVFSGNEILPGMRPFAVRYGGHQFGNWAGQLGDGRAISLGEIINGRGERWEIQLKGAGPTPYSRRADGRAVLRSSLREFLCSEAMHHLGIPTTRALSCVLTGDQVERDMFYDGHPAWEPGAITTRLAPTFLRFGNFEILAATGETENLRRLLDYAIRMHFPELGEPGPEAYAAFFRTVCERTLALMVEWMRVGFVHGVMNTDNMSILGLTIDYGPYGWLDVYDPDWTPNTTDAGRRRYRFSQQPGIGLWNLARLAEAIAPLFADYSALEEALEDFGPRFQEAYFEMSAAKLGLADRRPEDGELIRDLDTALRAREVDMTLFFRALATLHGRAEAESTELMRDVFYQEADPRLTDWISRYRARTAHENAEAIRARMNQRNPFFVLRNYLVQEALDELAEGGRSKLDALSLALKTPYEANANTIPFAKKRPEWARQRPGCSALSCSS